MADDNIRIEIDTEAESYPVLVIREYQASRTYEVYVPREMYDRLTEAERQVTQAQLEIMRYVGGRYDVPDVREWLSDYDD